MRRRWVRCGGSVGHPIHGESAFLRVGSAARRCRDNERCPVPCSPGIAGARHIWVWPGLSPWAIHRESRCSIGPGARGDRRGSGGAQTGRTPPDLIHGESDTRGSVEMIPDDESCRLSRPDPENGGLRRAGKGVGDRGGSTCGTARRLPRIRFTVNHEPLAPRRRFTVNHPALSGRYRLIARFA